MDSNTEYPLGGRSATTSETTVSPLYNHDDSRKYPRFATWRKYTILFVVSWMTLAITFSSTSLLPATPEIAAEFGTSPEILNISNAGVLIAMGISSFIWGPISDISGRRRSYNTAIFILCACSVGAAAAPDMRTFTAMRVCAGLTGTYFMVAGQTMLADIFEPTVRGRAVGFFMAGTVTGPAVGPCIGGIIVTYTNWRIIFWLQVGMSGFGLIMSLIFVPDIQGIVKKRGNGDQASTPIILKLLRNFNPKGVFRQFIYPNVLFADLTCGFLAATQYSMLTSTRSVINPRFHLTSPLVSGLFYIAPGTGFLVGSILGGKFSDRTVKKYIKKRNGVRLPQDRLNSGLVGLFFILPAAMLVYGWTLQGRVGGMALPVVSAFFGGLGLMGTFNGLNTYAAEVMPLRRLEVMSGKYVVQYTFAAASSAAVVPLTKSIGVGWTFTISVVFALIGGMLVLSIIRCGLDMQRWVESAFGRKTED